MIPFYVALFLFFAALVSRPTWADDLVFENAHIADPETKTVKEGSLVVKNGRITQVGGKTPAGLKSKKMDATGLWIIPGLVDTHDHSTLNNPGPNGVVDRLTTEDVMKMMLYCGVTSFLDLFADEKAIFKARNLQRQKLTLGSTLYAAGPMMTCQNGHGTEFDIPTRTMDSPDEARRQVDLLAQQKPDVVKIAYDHSEEAPAMSKATMTALIAEAKKLKLKTIVHIGTWQDASDAIDAGATVVTHFGQGEMPDELAAKFRGRGVWEIPTMTYQSDLLYLVENRSLLRSPLLLPLISKKLLAAYQNIEVNDSFVAKILARQNKSRDTYLGAVKKLSDAGVPLMVGTDSGDLGVFHGFSVHREMAIFVRAGLTPWQALAAGSTMPKKFLNLKSGIAVGDKADFIVVKGSPVADIENTQNIETVVQNGKMVDRPALLKFKPIQE
jgi:imidazolonepropionase-like amidohydrolase